MYNFVDNSFKHGRVDVYICNANSYFLYFLTTNPSFPHELESILNFGANQKSIKIAIYFWK